jgi:hypothetical protein
MRFAAIVVVLAACAHTAAPTGPSNTTAPPVPVADCGTPEDFHADEMAAAGFHDMNFEDRTPYAAAEARVLAWDRWDSSAATVDEALLWIRRTDGGFALMNVYRHPTSPHNPPDRVPHWTLWTVTDSRNYYGEHDYPQPPSHADLDGFLDTGGWPFKLEDDEHMTGSGVCAAAWQASFGEAPWHAYAK